MNKSKSVFNSIGYWITDGNLKGTSTGKLILLGLGIMVPIFLVAIAPFLAWISIAPEHRYDEKYYWLQDLSWIWPVCIVVLGVLSAIGYMLYNYIRDTKS